MRLESNIKTIEGLPLETFKHFQARHSMAYLDHVYSALYSLQFAVFGKPIYADSWWHRILFIQTCSEYFWIISRHHNMSRHIPSFQIKTRSNHVMSYPFMSHHNPTTLQPPTSLNHFQCPMFSQADDIGMLIGDHLLILSDDPGSHTSTSVVIHLPPLAWLQFILYQTLASLSVGMVWPWPGCM